MIEIEKEQSVKGYDTVKVKFPEGFFEAGLNATISIMGVTNAMLTTSNKGRLQAFFRVPNTRTEIFIGEVRKLADNINHRQPTV